MGGRSCCSSRPPCCPPASSTRARSTATSPPSRAASSRCSTSTAPPIDTLNSRAARLQEGIEEAGAAQGAPVTVTRSGSILNVHPGGDPVTTPADAARFPVFRAALHLALLAERVYTSTRGMINLSTALVDDDLDAVARAYSAALQRLAPHLDRLLDEESAR